MSLFTLTILIAWGALVRGYTETKVINRMVKLFWSLVKKLGISVWFEIVRSVFNPADAPTRDAPLPFPVRGKSKFELLESIWIWIESDDLDGDQFHPPMNNSQFYRVMGGHADAADIC